MIFLATQIFLFVRLLYSAITSVDFLVNTIVTIGTRVKQIPSMFIGPCVLLISVFSAHACLEYLYRQLLHGRCNRSDDVMTRNSHYHNQNCSTVFVLLGMFCKIR